MSIERKNWSKSDILYGVIAPLIVVLVIVGFSQVTLMFRWGSFGLIVGIISEIEEIMLTVAVPLLLGLLWNKWAGGASGFLMGNIYALWFATTYGAFSCSTTSTTGQFFPSIVFGLGPTLLGYVLSPMLIGYMAGALNKRSENFRRMLISSLVATTIAGFFLFWIFQLSPMNVVTGIDGFLITVVTRIACGVLTAIAAKIFIWYGQTPTFKM
ncbi:MAG: hypothetical protein ACPLRY_04575 [Candidatus Bathyarchaeales archaeon]